jgi:hypothetical protein
MWTSAPRILQFAVVKNVLISQEVIDVGRGVCAGFQDIRMALAKVWKMS